MGYFITFERANEILKEIGKTYTIYAPKLYPKTGRYSDTDIIKYDSIEKVEEIVFEKKSDYPAKEVITPIQETTFFFTEDEWRESKAPKKPILIFARPCDINAQRIQERIYNNGGINDFYYDRMRNNVKFVLMDCHGGDDDCFCVSMGQNKTDDYCMSFYDTEYGFDITIKDPIFEKYFLDDIKKDTVVNFVEKNELSVSIPEIKNEEVLEQLKKHPVWNEYNRRCISCGACTVACSTCTCFTTKDVAYTDNGKVGERKRVTASCQIDDYSKVAGGGDYRTTAGERMRFKVLHKFHDYKERFGEEHMCVGCGRCISRCPQHITITATVHKMSEAIKEINIMLKDKGEVENGATK